MQAIKPVGRKASALKYDILSVLGVTALSGSKHDQRRALRLMVLITARYNWQNNELSIGRAEMARLWSVDERTVKRELAALRALGWLQVKRAGVRGRVTVYALDLDALLSHTRDAWPVIGRDVEARLSTPEQALPDDRNVIPFQPPRPACEPGPWGAVLDTLTQQDAALTRAWFGQLRHAETRDGTAVLMAPSRFVADYVRTHLLGRLLAVWSAQDAALRDIRIMAP